jgi:hypothetical protein
VEQYRSRASERAQTSYRWEDVVRQHLIFYEQVLGESAAIPLKGVKSFDS